MSFLTRRTTLRLLGIGSASLLTSCNLNVKVAQNNSSGEATSTSPAAEASSTAASSSSSAGSSSSAVSSTSSGTGKQKYKGKLQFNSYEGSVSNYKPGTSSRKAENVPKPKAPEGMNEKTLDGLYKFLGYWTALWNYVLLTGETTDFVKTLDKVDEFKDFIDSVEEIYSINSGWIISSTNTPLEISLTQNMPYEGPKAENYVWVCDSTIDSNAKVHNAAEPEDSKFLTEVTSKIGYFYTTFRNSSWVILSESIDGFVPKKYAAF